MPVNLPDNVAHNNPAYPIVLSEDLGGTARVVTDVLTNASLLAVSSFKRALGTIIYSISAVKYYKYVGSDTTNGVWGNLENWIEIADAPNWGDIGGDILNQTDLQAALNKLETLSIVYAIALG